MVMVSKVDIRATAWPSRDLMRPFDQGDGMEVVGVAWLVDGRVMLILKTPAGFALRALPPEFSEQLGSLA